MEKYIDVYKTCRICLKQVEDETLLDLLDDEIFKLYIKITSIEVNICDKSYNICNSCYLKLESIQEFISSSRENHELMIQHIEKVSKSIIEGTEETISNDSHINKSNCADSSNSTIHNSNDTNSKYSLTPYNDEEINMLNENNQVKNINFGTNNIKEVIDNGEETENLKSTDLFQNDTEDESLMSDICNKEDSVGKKSNNSLQKKKRLTQFPCDVVLSEIKLIRNKNKKANVRCIKCNFISIKMAYLISHMKYLHKDFISNWCQYCNSEVSNLSEHKNVHSEDLKCTFCNKIFKKKSNLLEHLFSHSDKQLFACDICHQSFATNGSLLKHANECDDSRPNNKKNKKITSRVPDSALCSICGKEFKTKSKLEVHMRSHSGFAPYKCSYCDKCMSTRSQLVMHERTHTGERPYVCNICGKGFTQSGVLKTHLRQHTGKPDVCMICDKRFSRPALLKIHMRKHTGEKPYVCSDCGQSFIQQSHLTDHEKTHRDERPFECEICMRGFRQKSSLKTHINIHLGEKPFKCKQCPYACRQSYSLTQHMKQHTDNH